MSSRHRYLEWVLANFPRARFNLANSAVSTPPCALLGDAFAGAPAPLEPAVLEGPAREAVAALYGVAPARVVPALGTSGANFLALSRWARPGTVVAVEEPAYEPLLIVPETGGAQLVRYPVHDSDALAAALARVTGAGVRVALVVASTPHNPTGRVLSPAEAAALAEVSARHGALLLVDEVYLDALADPPPSTAAIPGTIVTSSLTKSYGLGAIRFGWAVAPDEAVAADLRDVSRDAVGALATPLLALGLAALARRDALLARTRAQLAANHAAWRALCTAAGPRLVARTAVPGVIAWAELGAGDGGDADALAFAARLLDAHQTLVAPGNFFEAPRFARVGLGGDPAVVREGLARVGAALGAAA
ncbi:MAG TPA: pyridoxal phosphate-dependent aminotransferase [Myxococcota bacterium]|jgi:aspartate/methionine/tyrosine aminotransferase|nr:pyridoxal phosphate-dependent aminotransferase [Myxococcota bacterium]